jgi:hypothetical protein
MWTAPNGKLFFDVTNDLVSFSHMSGLLVRQRWPLALMISDCRGPYHCGELEAHDGWRGIPGFGVTVSFITS